MPALALCLSALTGSFVSAFLPAVNAELLLAGLVAVAPPPLLLPLVGLTTAGQMGGKVLLYLAGRGVILLPAGRLSTLMERATARAARHQGVGGTLLFASAFAGVPPFYFTSITAGLARFSFRHFLLLGSLGRFFRFAVVALVPFAVKALL